MKPLKFLIAATVAQHLRAFHLPVVHWLRGRGHEVQGAAAGLTTDARSKGAFSRVNEVSFSRNPRDLLVLMRAFRQMRRLLLEERYDIIHVHTPIAAFITRLAAANVRKSGSRVVYTAHGFHFISGGSALSNGIYKRLEEVAGPWTDALAVINDEDYAQAVAMKLVPRQRLVAMPGVGIDLRHFSRDNVKSGILRRELQISAEEKLVVMTAELSPVKRHGDALSAFALQGMERYHLVLCGAGRIESELKRLAAGLGISSRVHFLGFRDDIREVLADADVSLLVSEREGLPLSIMEAMAMNVPVVGSNVRGIRDLLAGGAGLLCNIGDIRAISAAIREVSSTIGVKERLVSEAAKRVAQYRIENVLSCHLKLYDMVVPGFSRSGI